MLKWDSENSNNDSTKNLTETSEDTQYGHTPIPPSEDSDTVLAD